MVLKLYNTLTRKKEDFVSLESGKVSLYCCGPTVYFYAHLGNLRTYVFEDILRRVLEYNKYSVNHVMNITDVGHLTSDADEGEDKMEAGARREGKTVWQIAEYYTNAFFEDTKKLNILTPSVVCKATDHIDHIIEMIQKLESNGYTYVSEGNVYFDVSKFTYYRDLGRLNLEDLRATERVSEDTGKRNPQDFALWFTNSKFKNHAMQWDSPWGRGYPGWHIECSAMSTHYLGEQFDIHCGGIDHIQVHHTNEIAQSEGSGCKHPWVKYWMHGEFLVLDNARMGKSEGNSLTVSKVVEKGYDPLVYRYFCLTAHYRQKLNFTWEALDHAKNSLESVRNKVRGLAAPSNSDAVLEYKKKFLTAINDDLNMPQALALLHEVLKSDTLQSGEKHALVKDFDSVLGLHLDAVESKQLSPQEQAAVDSLLKQRDAARASKDWAAADKIRDEIRAKGYVLKDTPEGTVVEKA